MTTTDPFERAVLKAIQESMDGGEGAEPLRAPDLDDLSDGELEGLMCNADQGCCENAFPVGAAMSGRAQTGPKGVIADHREHMRRQQAAKQQRDRDLMAKLNKQSMGLTLRQPESKTFRAGGETDAACSRLSKSDDDDDDLDDDDDIAMAAYREQRLREIMDKRASRGYGKDTVHEVEHEPPGVAVIVHLFESHIHECRAVHRALDGLARRYGFAKFLCIPSREADASFDEVALPAILAYRSGGLQATVLRVHDEVRSGSHNAGNSITQKYGGLAGDDLIIPVDDLEMLLRRNQALDEEDFCELTAGSSMSRRDVTDSEANDD